MRSNSKNPKITLSEVVDELGLTPEQGAWVEQTSVIVKGFPVYYEGKTLKANPGEVANWLIDEGLAHWLNGGPYEVEEEEEENETDTNDEDDETDDHLIRHKRRW